MLNPKMQLALVLLLEFLCLAAADAVAEATPCSCDADNICTCNAGQKLELNSGSSGAITWKKEGKTLNDDWATFDPANTKQKATIGSLKLTDKGTYVAIEGDFADCKVKKVFVVKIVDRVTSVTVKRYTGNTVALHCLVGNQDWKKFKTFEWKKDGEAIGPSAKRKLKMNNAMLIIIDASASDNGDYSCVGKSFDGVEKKSVSFPLRV
ncbi:uncharacterized protein LOC133154250 isoform X3 [Syngnathus typhle]|uniref:uncharacterized protein LOC133154250 isoform X3 n=1 Tax=Syngnathus typhle TaxID=161592 RepID=UPI002A6A6A68|nr:uncharacterized protein LOC133154250 isoform X3 [Syngnathus typhle]